MKNRQLLFPLLLTILSCQGHAQTSQEDFKAERVSKTASFVVDAGIDTVFPLFGAFEERKWEPAWKPVLIYPDKEVIAEGTAFKVDMHGHGPETESLWIVSKYDVKAHLIQYLVSTDNRFWTITVTCQGTKGGNKTDVSVTYAFTSLNELGHKLNQHSLENMFKQNLQDWAQALNSYLN